MANCDKQSQRNAWYNVQTGKPGACDWAEKQKLKASFEAGLQNTTAGIPVMSQLTNIITNFDLI